MSKLVKQALTSQGLRSASLVTVGNVAATGLSAVAMIIFSRLLGPTDFGIFSALFSLLLILSKVGDLGLNIALQRYLAGHRKETSKNIATSQTVAALKLGIAVILILTGLIFGRFFTLQVLKLSADYAPLVTLIFIFSSTVIYYEFVNVIMQGMHRFGVSVLTNFVQSLGKLVGAVAFYLGQSVSVLAVVLLYFFTPLLGALVGQSQLPLSYLVPKLDKQRLSSILTVTRWTSISIISATLADNLDVLIVQNFLSSYDTGIWSAAVRIATVASLIGWSLGMVLNVRVAAYKSKEHLQAYLRKAASLSLVALVGISLLGFLSRPLLFYTVGPEFLSAIPSLNLLFVSTALLTATSPFVALFYLFDKPQYFAYSGLLSSLLLIGGDLLAIPLFGILGAGYVRIAVRLAVLVFTLLYARRAYLQAYSPQKSKS